MIKVFSVSEMVAAERASDAAGNSYDDMMEKAGAAVAQAIIERYPVKDRRVTILVGPGNNGGDGLVAGRYLAEAGADVAFYLFKGRDPEADINLAKVQEMALPVLIAEYDQRYRVLRNRLKITDILMDALLGTGVSRPIGGELAKLMRQVQSVRRDQERMEASAEGSRLVSISQVTGPAAGPLPTVVAVDCPSGLNCDNGALDTLAIPADLTVTFAGPKRGHFIFPGAAACGELVVADIDISPKLPEVAAVKTELATAEMARTLLPQRTRAGHKGTFGWVLIAAGSHRYWGAAALAGTAAYRAGAGLVAMAVPSVIRASLASQLPEATYPLVTDEEVLGAQAARLLLAEMKVFKALLIGPGLYEATEFLELMLAPPNVTDLPPLVVDADGLNILARWTDWPDRLPQNTILTPHPGEMARLMDVPINEVQGSDRVELAREKATQWNCVVLFKGAFTVVAAPDGQCTILPFADPVLATAGSGDVLAGVIVALLGQGLAPYEAAILGGYLHAAAGVSTGIDSGLLAGEIATAFPEVRQKLLN